MKSAWITKKQYYIFGNCSCNRIDILQLKSWKHCKKKMTLICCMTTKLIHFLQLHYNNSNSSYQVPFSSPIPEITIYISDFGIGPTTTITSPSRQWCQDFMPLFVMMFRHIHYTLLFSKVIVFIYYSFSRETCNGVQWEWTMPQGQCHTV